MHFIRTKSLCEKPKLLEERGGAYYSDAACSLIDSIYNDRGDIQVVNTKNNGAIENFEVDETVEVSCRITKKRSCSGNRWETAKSCKRSDSAD